MEVVKHEYDEFEKEQTKIKDIFHRNLSKN